MAEQFAPRTHSVCDYEGTSYRARFWEGQGREYEDLAERIALRRLLPPTGHRLLELGLARRRGRPDVRSFLPPTGGGAW